jgi:outer membrane biosynthesis protein TonB
MKGTLNLPLTVALLLITAHRLPAPIQDVPENATPAPTVAPAPEPRKSLPKPKSKTTGAARFAGTWTGTITIDQFPNTDVTFIINAEGTSVNQSSRAGIWTRPLTYDGKLLSWQTGPTNKVGWTLKLNSDEQSALVTRIWSGIQTRGIFKRVRSTDAPPNTMPVAQATKETQSSGDASLPKGAVHLVINSDSDARKIFTYFRFPRAQAPPGTTGAYRLEVNPDGTVAAVTILKSMGSAMDAGSMKAFTKWRAEPGPLRIVDVGRQIVRIERVISR